MVDRSTEVARENRRIRRSVPVSRYERAVALRNGDQAALGELLITIDVELRKLSHAVDAAAELCSGRPAGGSIGGGIRASQTAPRHEIAFEWLDAVRDGLEELMREKP